MFLHLLPTVTEIINVLHTLGKLMSVDKCYVCNIGSKIIVPWEYVLKQETFSGA
jgi:hypothetical protein